MGIFDSFLNKVGDAFDRNIDAYTDSYLQGKRAQEERRFAVEDPASFQRTDQRQGAESARELAGNNGGLSKYLPYVIGAAVLGGLVVFLTRR